MSKLQRPNRARQLKPSKVGVAEWQRDFWLTLLEHELAGKRGQPNLSRLQGFEKAAVTRFAVTTPELWHSFDSYNKEKPYHEQVRPFGFMLSFQLKENSAELMDDIGPRRKQTRRQSSMIHVLAPFDRDPAKAARKAFDRDTGKAVTPTQLKSYARALRHYYSHPESKFLNGDHAERGPTQPRNVVALSIRHIGKEANRLGEQMTLGADPEAQEDYGSLAQARSERLRLIRQAVSTFGSNTVASAAGVSRQHLFAITVKGTTTTDHTLERIELAIARINAVKVFERAEAEQIRQRVRLAIETVGVRAFADLANLSAAHVSRIMSGRRQITSACAFKLREALLQRT